MFYLKESLSTLLMKRIIEILTPSDFKGLLLLLYPFFWWEIEMEVNEISSKMRGSRRTNNHDFHPNIYFSLSNLSNYRFLSVLHIEVRNRSLADRELIGGEIWRQSGGMAFGWICVASNCVFSLYLFVAYMVFGL